MASPLKWFTGKWGWIGYVTVSVGVAVLYWFVGPRLSAAVNVGGAAVVVVALVVDLTVGQRLHAAGRAHHTAGELAYDRARAEHREVRALYEKIYAELDEGAGK